uniref:NADH-ubiquinone oxidoreductase chain 5 n=1 Tax=Micrura ignea TaxID=328822 RepID=A0A0D5NU14_9BILA|nr:NADH dehydrogenase subunit 5 [Micrura ignea]AJY78584.1 NADH dehydrogenase subunit 5 [Micrura ignea]
MWWKYYVSSVLSWFMYLLFILLLSVLMIVSYGGVPLIITWEVCSVATGVVEFSLVLDWVSLSFGSIVVFISASVLWFASSYMDGDSFLPRFSWIVFLFVLSMSFVIFIPNLMAILLGWDGLGLVSFLLVVYYQNAKSLAAGMITVLMNRVGDVMILLSIGWLCWEGNWNILSLSCDSSGGLIALFVMVAGMTKSAQVPFSSWLPAAMAAPTPVSALVHSSTLVTAGVFLLIRFYPYLSFFPWFNFGLLFVSCVTMLMAGIAANLENDLKKVIALSTLSQLGVMMASLGLGCWELALFHLYTHALFKALLFLCAGSFIHRAHHAQDLRLFGSLWGQMPVVVSCLNVANLALCGAPFLAGFYSKDLILESSLVGVCNWVIIFMIFLATGMTAAYSVRMSYWSLWGTFNMYVSHNVGGESDQEVFPMMCLVVGAVVVGSGLSWLCFYGVDVYVINSVSKLAAVIVTVVGVCVGWSLSSVKDVLLDKEGVFWCDDQVRPSLYVVSGALDWSGCVAVSFVYGAEVSLCCGSGLSSSCWWGSKIWNLKVGCGEGPKLLS